MKRFYITTAIPYVNAKPHIGHTLEFVQADAIARYQAQQGYSVRLLSGGDENALKNVQAAEAAGKNIQAFIDENTQSFYDIAKRLDVEFHIFQKGSDQTHHFPASQHLWNLCAASKNAQGESDIYEKSYEGLYCVGCELFYTPDELNEQGECFEHPGKKLVSIKEKNYFFRLSRYQDDIVRLLESDTLRVYPEFRKNEILSFVRKGLEDISISRSNERAKNWGVPVPHDPSQRMYVWFDALNIYQSGVGFGWDEKQYKTWWPADVHVIGKGISRFHAVYWPAFLLSAKLPLPKSLFIHGYFTVNGQKMSKTLGNVIDPNVLIDTYGPDPLRYYFLREIPAYSDGDFSERRFQELYNADLANTLGNLLSRIEKLGSMHDVSGSTLKPKTHVLTQKIAEHMKTYQFDESLKRIIEATTLLNKFLDEKQPWKQTKDEAAQTIITVIEGSPSIPSFLEIAEALRPFLPQTAASITTRLTKKTLSSESPLFPRL